MPIPRAFLSAAAVLVALLVTASAASAATTIGQTSAAASACGGFGYSELQTASAGPSYEVPAGSGLITSWSTYAGSDATAVVRLKVFRRTSSATDFVAVGQSAAQPLTPNSLNTFPTHVVVRPGDLLGMYMEAGSNPACQISTSDAADVMTQLSPDTSAPGDTATGASDFAGFRVNVSAVVQPLTTMSLNCAPASVSVGNTAACTATVTTAGGGPAPAGAVALSPGGGSCTLGGASGSSSSCSAGYTPAAPGAATVTGTYTGQAEGQQETNAASTGLTVAKRTTRTTVACAPSPLPAGRSTTCTATVADGDTGVATMPGGTVTFPSGSCTLGILTAACSVKLTASKTGPVAASYGGDATHAPSTGEAAVKTLGRYRGSSVLSRTVIVKKGVAKVRLRSAIAAKGTLWLLAGRRVLGTARFSLKAGRAKVVRVRVRRAALGKGVVRTTAKDAFGRKKTVTRNVRLKR